MEKQNKPAVFSESSLSSPQVKIPAAMVIRVAEIPLIAITPNGPNKLETFAIPKNLKKAIKIHGSGLIFKFKAYKK